MLPRSLKLLLTLLSARGFAPPPPRIDRRAVARSFDAATAAADLFADPTARFEAAALVVLASFASKVEQSPLKREKKNVKPRTVSKAEWRKGQVACWALTSLSADASDAAFAIAFLQAWAERTCEVGALRSRARCVPTDDGVRSLWVSRGPGYLSQAEERRLEATFEKISPAKREGTDRARSSYAYGARRAKTGVGGVDLSVGRDAGQLVLAMRRCGYADNEPVKEGSERAATVALSQDLKLAFGAEVSRGFRLMYDVPSSISGSD